MRVAVYGSLKKNCTNHSLLACTKFIGTDIIPNWDMYSFGYFPCIIPGDGKIFTEIYEITDLDLKRLDRLEGYPSFYDRKEVDTEFGKAWIYYHHQLHDNLPKVKSGNWGQLL